MKKQIFLGALLCLYASMPAWAQNKAFIQNVGQITDPQLQPRTDLDFKVSDQKGLQVYVGKGQLHYQWIEAEHTSDSTTLYHSYRLDMQLVGSNRNPRLSYGQQQQAYERHFLSWVNTDNSNEGKVAHRYNSVTYHNIYPHIDWKLYFTADGKMEYDFIVNPGGKVSDIQLMYEGADSLNIDQQGRLNIYTPKGQLVESAPYSYEQKSKRPIASHFQLLGNKISFSTAVHKGTLVIDPIIEWGTYFGDVASDMINGVSTDANHNIIMVGTTSSVANIATTGSHQQTFGGGSYIYGGDAFIAKADSSSQLLWASYYGGSSNDLLKTVKVDNNDNIYAIGYTQSTSGIASVNAFQEIKSGNASTNDIFLVKVDANGNRQWSTYYGGTMEDGHLGLDMDLDDQANVYLTGNTQSNNIFISPNAYNTTRQLTDLVIASFDSNGAIRLSTYFGGAGTDVPNSIKVLNNYIYIGGYTESTAGFGINSNYQSTLAGNKDGFICKLDTALHPVWSTYFGGTLEDRIVSIDVIDSMIVFGGITKSSIGIATINSHQTFIGGNMDGFIGSMDTSGTLKWSSYYGGIGNDYIKKVNWNDERQMYLILETYSADSIVTPHGFKTILDNSMDIGLVKMNNNGTRLWGSYLGGNYIEIGNTITTLPNSKLLIVGGTNSGNNIGTANTHQTALAGDYDGFLIKINDCDAPIITNNITGPDTLCPHTTALYSIASIPDASTYHWLLPTGWHGQSDSNSIAVMVHGQSGTVSVYTQSACGGISDTVHFDVHVYPNRTITIQRQNNILRTTQVFPSYQWLMNGNPIAGATNSTYIPTSNGIYSLQVVDDNGCEFVSNTIDLTHLSIVDPTNKQLAIYPNPTEGNLELNLPNAGTIQVIDLLGRNCLQVQVAAGKQQLDLSKLPTGTYTVLYTTADGQYSGLVVKE